MSKIFAQVMSELKVTHQTSSPYHAVIWYDLEILQSQTGSGMMGCRYYCFLSAKLAKSF